MTETRNWLITGCSSGFGRALAQAALAEGDNVVLTARATDTLNELIDQYPRRALPMRLDVTDPEQITAAVRVAEQTFGGVDVLVNNAGYGLIGAIEETDPAEYRSMFETNFFGAIAMTQAVLPAMRRRRRGHIVNISSVAALTCRPGYGFYAASKSALEGASEALAQELRPLGIFVTLVEPGPFRTDFAGRSLGMAENVIDDYAATSGASRDAIRGRSGSQAGDPARAAEVIIAATRVVEPPLRLPLGSHAYDRIREKLAAVTADVEQWEAAAGRAVEFP